MKCKGDKSGGGAERGRPPPCADFPMTVTRPAGFGGPRICNELFAFSEGAAGAVALFGNTARDGRGMADPAVFDCSISVGKGQGAKSFRLHFSRSTARPEHTSPGQGGGLRKRRKPGRGAKRHPAAMQVERQAVQDGKRRGDPRNAAPGGHASRTASGAGRRNKVRTVCENGRRRRKSAGRQ